MVPCFSPRLLIIRTFSISNIAFISSGVAVVAKSRSSGCFPMSKSLTAPPAIRRSYACFWNSSINRLSSGVNKAWNSGVSSFIVFRLAAGL
ncbi:hypothetical protein NP493_798g00007 [Ridgeia piscesae]|uniref:Uncharacterized protein n=1 Tax=Ridgeia piscesae TaxID=27915 RepID=A0AAD9NPE0_RIDPI|nr:hypothetical protein NP493_798g00007 [Ridgeia piscesae]